jgi:hypothetical protein
MSSANLLAPASQSIGGAGSGPSLIFDNRQVRRPCWRQPPTQLDWPPLNRAALAARRSRASRVACKSVCVCVTNRGWGLVVVVGSARLPAAGWLNEIFVDS